MGNKPEVTPEVTAYFKKIGRLGGMERARKNNPQQLRNLGKLGGRPYTIAAIILNCLKSGPKSREQIIDKTGFPSTRVSYVLWYLKKRQLVKKEGENWIRIKHESRRKGSRPKPEVQKENGQ